MAGPIQVARAAKGEALSGEVLRSGLQAALDIAALHQVVSGWPK